MATFVRTPLEVLEDAITKKRVLDGIALLEAEYGSDWVDKIDLDTLQLSSSTHCVLGQLYGDVDVEALPPVQKARLDKHLDDNFGEDGRTYALNQFVASDDGYNKGRILLDGPLEEPDGPERFGFDVGYEAYLGDLMEKTDDALVEVGCTREQIADAIQYAETAAVYHPSVYIDYTDLDRAWEDVITSLRAS